MCIDIEGLMAATQVFVMLMLLFGAVATMVWLTFFILKGARKSWNEISKE